MATTSCLDRLLDPLTEAFAPKEAAAFVERRLDSELEAHISDYAGRRNGRTLTPDEDADTRI